MWVRNGLIIILVNVIAEWAKYYRDTTARVLSLVVATAVAQREMKIVCVCVFLCKCEESKSSSKEKRVNILAHRATQVPRITHIYVYIRAHMHTLADSTGVKWHLSLCEQLLDQTGSTNNKFFSLSYLQSFKNAKIIFF